jgi:hypothetical protein
MLERELPELAGGSFRVHEVPALDGALEIGAEGRNL